MSDNSSSDLRAAVEGGESPVPAGSDDGETRRAIVPIGSITAGDTPRLNGVDPEHVHLLTKTGSTLPPILVERSTMRVIDGMHRLRAAVARGQSTIEVEFFDGSERAAFVRAVEANIAHGLPLSLADRRAAAERIIELYPEWSDRRVAASAGVSDKTVAAIRRSSTAESTQLSARVGRDGRARPLNGATGRWIASELIEERPNASLREIAREAGISVATVRDVRERMRKGENPIPTMLRGDVGRKPEDGTSSGINGRPTTDGVPATPAGRQRVADGGHDANLDCGRLLEGLKRDPSLRYSDAGRALLRWLDLRTVRSKELEGITAQVPPHAAILIARVARQCSVAWENLAAELELRNQDAA